MIMKRFTCILAALVLSICMAGSCLAASGDMDTLADWGISVPLPDNCIAVLDGSDGCYYIYTEGEGIPYVMLYVYEGYKDENDFADNYLYAMMAANYEDIEVVSDWQPVTFGSKKGYEVDFTYTVSGYWVLDRRVAILNNGRIYLFTSKEVEELDLTVGTLLEDTIAGCVFEGEDNVEVNKPSTDSEIQEITWEEILDGMTEEDYDGAFVQFDDLGIEIFIPNDFLPMEVDEEMKDMYYLGYFTPDEETWDPAITVQYVDSMGIEKFEDYRTIIESMEGDVTEIMGEVIINGFHCLMYQIPENDVLVIGTVIEDGVMEVTFMPFSNDELMGLFELTAGSIREIEENGDDVDIIIDDGNDIIIDDGNDIVINYDPTENNLADLIQDLLDQLQQQGQN